MRLESVRIQNLRSFEDATIEFSDYTCLVGPNGSGKSNVLCALNIFFRESEGYATDLNLLDAEDFHHKNTGEPITITVTFTDLGEEAQQEFAHYFRQGQLVVSAIAHFDKSSGKAEVKQFGQRQGMKAFAKFFEAEKEGKKVAELKEVYEAIREAHPDLPQSGPKAVMTGALNDYEAKHPSDCELIASEDQFYGISRGKNLLAKYVQWVYIPAVKDAATEQMEARNTALGKLLARTVRAKTNFSEAVNGLRGRAQQEYQQLLDESQDALDDISDALKRRLIDWAHPDANLWLQWRQDPERSVRVDEPWAQIVAGEGEFEGELARFGHGLQRSYILALLQELSGSGDVEGPRMILACEEPELYQHPPQARHLYDVFQNLSQANSQAIICTHSPYFVSGESFESVRLVRKVNGRSKVSQVTHAQIAKMLSEATGEPPLKPSGSLAKIHQALRPTLSEMFFAERLVLVEGLEDAAYIATYLHLMGLWDDYRRYGCHIVPANCKSAMIRPLAVAKGLRIPTFIVFDADDDKPERNGSRARHEKDNRTILRLCGIDNPDPFPTATFWGDNVVMWNSDIGTVVRGEIGPSKWDSYCAKADAHFSQAGGLRKTSLHIADSLTQAWNDGLSSTSLEKLCQEIVAFGKDS